MSSTDGRFRRRRWRTDGRRQSRGRFPVVEVIIAVLAIGLGLAILPVDGGSIRWGMEATTRETLAAGALTSAAVAAALAAADWRRTRADVAARTRAQSQMVALCDATVRRVLLTALHLETSAVRRAEHLAATGTAIGDWTSEDLAVLARTLMAFSVSLPAAGDNSPVKHRDIVLATEMASHVTVASDLDQDRMTALVGGRQLPSDEAWLLGRVAALLGELDRISSALLVQNAGAVAQPVLDFAAALEASTGAAERSVRWRVYLVRLLTAWLAAAENAGDGGERGGFSEFVDTFAPDALAEALDPDNPTWTTDPAARGRWLRERRREATGLSPGAALSRREEKRTRRSSHVAAQPHPVAQPPEGGSQGGVEDADADSEPSGEKDGSGTQADGL
jgi:hypothetical protein